MQKCILIIFLATIINTSILSSQTHLQAINNTLVVEFKGAADSVFLDIKGGERLRLSEVKNDLWKKSIEIKNLDEAIIQYKINSGRENDKEYALFLGKKLKSLSQKKDSLRGQLIEEKLWSNSLQEERKLSIYLPESFEAFRTYPIIYLADGYVVRDYANYVERLIDDKKIAKIILVGIHSGETPEADKFDMAKNKRTLEYLNGISQFLPNADSSRYGKHLTFFCEEVIDYINSKFQEKEGQRSLYGFSNGASFAVSASLQYPRLYHHVMAFSIGWELAYANAIVPDEFPSFYLVAGSLEKDFYSITKAWADILKQKNKAFHLKKTISFHDDIMWRQAFLNQLEVIYGLR